MTSKKISEFIAQSSLTDSDFFDFIRNGTNYRVSHGDLKTSLGALGTLKQIGATTGMPILNKNGTAYEIRNLESGSGVIAELSAYNGIKLSLNIEQDDGGVAIIDDVGANKPKVASLKAGTGISVNKSGDEIQIALSGEQVTSKTVIVAEIDDFPAPVAGVITLANDTDYLVVNDIVTANRFVLSSNSILRSTGSQICKLEYTGTGVMFTGSDPNVRLERFTASCPNGTLLNITSPTNTGIFQMLEMNVESMNSGGTIDDVFICRIEAVAFEAVTAGGITFGGAIQELGINTGIYFLAGGTMFDLGTATFNSIFMSQNVVRTLAAGATFLDGAASSANVNVGGLATFNNNRKFGSGTLVSTIGSHDIRWYFLINDEVEDTRPDALLSVSGNTTETSISTIDTPVKVNAVWVDNRSSFFTVDSTGRSTYIGERPLITPVTFNSSALMASGSDNQVSMYIAVNGSIIPETKVQTTISSTKSNHFTNVWQVLLNTNDYVEVFIENNGGTTNIIVTDAVGRLD